MSAPQVLEHVRYVEPGRKFLWDEWRGNLDGSRVVMLVKHLAAWRGWRLDLHKIIGVDDAECFHTHPATAVRVILRGGYVEELYDDGDEVRARSIFNTYRPGIYREQRWFLGWFKTWLPLRIGVVRPAYCHRIHELPNGPSYSLWLRGPKVAEVQLVGKGWDAQRKRPE